jgi:hypothetical protein
LREIDGNTLGADSKTELTTVAGSGRIQLGMDFCWPAKITSTVLV